jgi:acetoacetyl-CoA reductase
MSTRIALVTGGIGGIGTSICQRLARDGYRVVAAYHPAEQGNVEAWVAARKAEGLEVGTISGDVSAAEDSARMVAEITEKYGPVDIVVNCAGITRDKTFRKMEADSWNAVINVNLNSVYNVTKPCWDGMIDRGWGRVINISSVNGQRGQFGQTNYSAAKASMHGFTMALAQEGAAKGVTVNTVSPGYIKTAMTAAIREDVLKSIIDGIPMKRMGTPEEIAAVVAFLASDDAAYITGANLQMNGGLFMH